MSVNIPFAPGISLNETVLPIVICYGRPDGYRIASFHGTGFIIAPGVFVTCWHCVSAQPGEGRHYAVVLPVPGGSTYRVLFLEDIFQHPQGLDLATARVAHMACVSMSLSQMAMPMGVDVMTYGYPHSVLVQRPNRDLSLDLCQRYLQGYITRVFTDEDRGYGPMQAYELDMPTPEGLSGAPLFRSESLEVVGVVYGSIEVSMLKHYQRTDDNGDVIPEVRKVATFGLAHFTEALHTLRGPATNGLPLREYMLRKK